MELEIALVIPAPNDGKYDRNNSAGQRFTLLLQHCGNTNLCNISYSFSVDGGPAPAATATTAQRPIAPPSLSDHFGGIPPVSAPNQILNQRHQGPMQQNALLGPVSIRFPLKRQI